MNSALLFREKERVPSVYTNKTTKLIILKNLNMLMPTMPTREYFYIELNHLHVSVAGADNMPKYSYNFTKLCQN